MSNSNNARREPFHELGRADLLVGLDAQQRVPTRFMVSVRDLGFEEAPQVWSSLSWVELAAAEAKNNTEFRQAGEKDTPLVTWRQHLEQLKR